MSLPSLTTPDGVFDYLIGLIIFLAGVGTLYMVAVAFGVITPLF
jgi:hypothetical protein